MYRVFTHFIKIHQYTI